MSLKRVFGLGAAVLLCLLSIASPRAGAVENEKKASRTAPLRIRIRMVDAPAPAEKAMLEVAFRNTSRRRLEILPSFPLGETMFHRINYVVGPFPLRLRQLASISARVPTTTVPLAPGEAVSYRVRFLGDCLTGDLPETATARFQLVYDPRLQRKRWHGKRTAIWWGEAESNVLTLRFNDQHIQVEGE
jgi:hypothetical protein